MTLIATNADKGTAQPMWRRHAKSQLTPMVAWTASMVTMLAVWQLAVVFGHRVPSMADTFGRIGSESADGQLLTNLTVSMNRFLLGLVAALLVGAALGVAMGLSRTADYALTDLTMAGLATPAVIWALLTTMWFGFGWLTTVTTVFLCGLPFVIVNIAKAVRAIPAETMLMARAFRVGRTEVLKNIIAPAVAGSTIAAVRFAIMSAWNGLLLAEWFGATSGVGWRARYWYDANQLDGFLAWVLLFIAFLIIANQALGWVENRATRWRRA